MRVGVAGFVGERLRQARKARGIPATELAEYAGVTTSQIHNYEREENAPSKAILARLASHLRLEVRFFLRPLRPHFSREHLFYRAKASATQAERDRAEARIAWLAEVVDFADRYVEFPALSLPDLDAPTDPRELTLEDVDRMAAAVRAHWGLGNGPIPNVIRIMEAKGIILGRDEFLSASLDGVSGWSSCTGRPFAVLSSDVASSARVRFSAAHEAGELITHRNVRLEGLHGKKDKAVRRLMDDQAHRFAGSFLLPEDAFLADLPFVTLDSLASIKPKWKVSIAAMIQRLRSLDLLGDSQYRSMQIGMSRRGWRLEEPLDNEVPVEEPVLLKQALSLMSEQGLLRPDDMVHELGIDDVTLGRLMNVPSETFRDTAGPHNIITLRAQ